MLFRSDIYNKRIIRSYALVGTTIANIVLTVWWIKQFGMLGAPIATAICTFIGQILFMNFYYFKYFEINVFYLFRQTFKGILIYQIVASGISFAIGSLISNVFIGFFVGGVAFLLVEFGGILFLGKSKTERANILYKLISKKKGD